MGNRIFATPPPATELQSGPERALAPAYALGGEWPAEKLGVAQIGNSPKKRQCKIAAKSGAQNIQHYKALKTEDGGNGMEKSAMPAGCAGVKEDVTFSV